MKTTILIAGLLAGSLAAGGAAAQTYEDGYRKGFQDGFAAGQSQAAKGQSVAPAPATVAPAPVAPAVPVAPVQVAPSPAPNYGISIMRAFYGDGDRSCNLTGRLAGSMNGRMSASLNVTNQLCGDPAPGERKHLQVDYTCGSGAKQASAAEHRTLYLSCP